MSNIVKKKIFFSPAIIMQKHKNCLIIGDSTKASKLKINIPIKIIKKENKLFIEKLFITSSNLNPYLAVRSGPRVPCPDQGVVVKEQRRVVADPSLFGTLHSNLKQLIRGFYKKHEIRLKLIGVGYRASLKKNILILRLGLSHKLFFEISKEITLTKIKKRPIVFSLKSNFLDVVTNFAFRIRSFKKPELYKGKGLLLANEFLILKEKKKV